MQRHLTNELYSHFYYDVLSFRELFGLPVEQFELPQANEELHLTLLQEEFFEVVTADSLVTQLGELADTIYVLVGAEVELGNDTPSLMTPWRRILIELCLTMFERLGKPVLPVWNEIQRANMAKACTTHEEVDATVKAYRDQGIPALVKEVKGRWVVLCADNCTDKDGKPVKAGKVLKNAYYRKADIAALV